MTALHARSRQQNAEQRLSKELGRSEGSLDETAAIIAHVGHSAKGQKTVKRQLAERSRDKRRHEALSWRERFAPSSRLQAAVDGAWPRVEPITFRASKPSWTPPHAVDKTERSQTVNWQARDDGDGHGDRDDDVQREPAPDSARNNLSVDRDKRDTGPESGGYQCFARCKVKS